MSPTEIARKDVVYAAPGMDAVTVRRDGSMDVYYPPGATSERFPAVMIVAGYPDAGFQKMAGCSFRDMQSSISWGRLIAASGMVAITYSNHEPAEDLHALIEHVRSNAPALAIDENRIGIWASSGNVPLALSLLMRPAGAYIKCAAFCYGLTLDLDGQTGVADAAKMFRFVNASAGKSIDDLANDIPMFIARAGADEVPRLNETLDRFVAAALSRDLPVTVVNHPGAPHAFDLFHDSETTREIIRRILAFLIEALNVRR